MLGLPTSPAKQSLLHLSHKKGNGGSGSLVLLPEARVDSGQLSPRCLAVVLTAELESMSE